MTHMTTGELWTYGVTIAVFLTISGFLSAAETALTSLSRARLYRLVMDGNKRAQLVSKMRKNKESLIGAILIGNNAVNIAASALATSIALRMFDEGSLLIATGVMTVLVVIFSEILPKTYAIQNSERASLALAPILYGIVLMLSPISRVIQWGIQRILILFGIDITKPNTLISGTDVIRGTIELHHREGTMIKQDKDMLGSILDLNDVEVQDITIHRTNVDMINANLSASEMISKAMGMMHSRIPFYEKEADNIIGVLHAKDLVQAIHRQGMELTREQVLELLQAPWFIPETTKLRDQLLAFRAERKHIALVVDEYGTWQGIVTLEDIIEEIVGNIEDEHDEMVAHGIVKAAEYAYFVDGNIPIRDVNRQLDWDLPDEEASTIAGLVMHEAKSIPPRGAIINIKDYQITVMDKQAAFIKRVKIEKTSQFMPDFEV